MKFTLLVTFTFFCATLGFGQYTDIINATKPGVAESAYAVGTGVFQLEDNNVLGNYKIQSLDKKVSYFTNQFNFKTGLFLEPLELQINGEYWTLTDQTLNISQDVTGFKKIAIGAKYQIYEPKLIENARAKYSWKARHQFSIEKLLPTIAVFSHVNLPVSNSYFKVNGTSLNLGVTAQNFFNDYWSTINQLKIDYLGSQRPQLSYALTNTYNLHERFSGLLEFEYKAQKEYYYTDISLGALYLVHPDIQLHSYYTYSANKNYSGHRFNVGLSFRIDKHKDKWVNLKNQKEKDKHKKAKTKQQENDREYYSPSNSENQIQYNTSPIQGY